MKIAIESLKLHLDFNLAFASAIVADVPKNKLFEVPAKGLENHPVWTIGHLVTGAALCTRLLGGEYNVKKEWDALFRRNGPGDPAMPPENPADYPDIAELLEALQHYHHQIKQLLDTKDEAFWTSQKQWRFAHRFHCYYDLVAFLITEHEAMHLGQLNAWRRAVGLDSAFAKM